MIISRGAISVRGNDIHQRAQCNAIDRFERSPSGGKTVGIRASCCYLRCTGVPAVRSRARFRRKLPARESPMLTSAHLSLVTVNARTRWWPVPTDERAKEGASPLLSHQKVIRFSGCFVCLCLYSTREKWDARSPPKMPKCTEK